MSKKVAELKANLLAATTQCATLKIEADAAFKAWKSSRAAKTSASRQALLKAHRLLQEEHKAAVEKCEKLADECKVLEPSAEPEGAAAADSTENVARKRQKLDEAPHSDVDLEEEYRQMEKLEKGSYTPPKDPRYIQYDSSLSPLPKHMLEDSADENEHAMPVDSQSGGDEHPMDVDPVEVDSARGAPKILHMPVTTAQIDGNDESVKIVPDLQSDDKFPQVGLVPGPTNIMIHDLQNGPPMQLADPKVIAQLLSRTGEPETSEEMKEELEDQTVMEREPVAEEKPSNSKLERKTKAAEATSNSTTTNAPKGPKLKRKQEEEEFEDDLDPEKEGRVPAGTAFELLERKRDEDKAAENYARLAPEVKAQTDKEALKSFNDVVNNRHKYMLRDGMKNLIRRIQGYLPQAAFTSRDIALEVLSNNRGNYVCLYHTLKKKSDDKATHLNGEVDHEFQITGQVFPRSVNAKKGDGVKRRRGHMHCGCSEEMALWELYIWKTWDVTCEVNGTWITETWEKELLKPRSREFAVQEFKKLTGLTLDDIYRNGADEVTHKMAMQKKTVHYLVAKYNELGDRRQGSARLEIVEHILPVAGPSNQPIAVSKDGNVGAQSSTGSKGEKVNTSHSSAV